MKSVVIGSGFGGIAAALRLKARGHKVILVEKHSDLGGRARVFKRNGFTYDGGPTVITAPYLIDELFQMHGKDSKDYYNLIKVSPFYRFIFSDKSHFDYGDNLLVMLRSIKKQYSYEDAQGYIALLKHSKRIFKTAFTKLSDKPFESLGLSLIHI